jgi:uncharacterized protein YndB with AHSA1/START domain
MGDGDRVVREVVLPARREDVWAAITRPEHLSEWFGGAVDLEPEPRGRVHHRDADGAAWEGVVLSADRPLRLAWWWSRVDADIEGVDEGTRVEFVLLEHPEGTTLTVTETPARRPSAGGHGAALALTRR